MLARFPIRKTKLNVAYIFFCLFFHSILFFSYPALAAYYFQFSSSQSIRSGGRRERAFLDFSDMGFSWARIVSALGVISLGGSSVWTRFGRVRSQILSRNNSRAPNKLLCCIWARRDGNRRNGTGRRDARRPTSRPANYNISLIRRVRAPIPGIFTVYRMFLYMYAPWRPILRFCFFFSFFFSFCIAAGDLSIQIIHNVSNYTCLNSFYYTYTLFEIILSDLECEFFLSSVTLYNIILKCASEQWK